MDARALSVPDWSLPPAYAGLLLKVMNESLGEWLWRDRRGVFNVEYFQNLAYSS